jgi:hypothetical protein
LLQGEGDQNGPTAELREIQQSPVYCTGGGAPYVFIFSARGAKFPI